MSNPDNVGKEHERLDNNKLESVEEESYKRHKGRSRFCWDQLQYRTYTKWFEGTLILLTSPKSTKKMLPKPPPKPKKKVQVATAGVQHRTEPGIVGHMC